MKSWPCITTLKFCIHLSWDQDLGFHEQCHLILNLSHPPKPSPPKHKLTYLFQVWWHDPILLHWRFCIHLSKKSMTEVSPSTPTWGVGGVVCCLLCQVVRSQEWWVWRGVWSCGEPKRWGQWWLSCHWLLKLHTQLE